MQFMLAGAPWLVFVGAPSGSTYQANQNGIFVVAANNLGDVTFLIASGCTPLTPFGAYALPPQTGWKPCSTSNLFPAGMSGLTNGKLMNCRVHTATQTMSGVIRLTLINIINLANVGDYWYPSGGPQNMGPITVNGTICYPGPNDVIGSYAATVINPGAMVDVFVNLSSPIPGGAKYYEGCFAVPASGQQLPVLPVYMLASPAQGPYTANSESPNTALGEGAVFSTSATDQTTNLASITGVGTNLPIYGASAICAVQPLTQPVACVNGDSLEQGFKAGTDAFNNEGPVAWGCGDLVPVLNSSISGKVAAADAGAGVSGTGYASAMTARLRWYEHCGGTHFFNCLCTNDVNGGTSLATCEADMLIIANLAAAIGLSPIIATLPPRTTSTDSWATTTNQTVTANESNRTGFNTWARTTPAPHIGFVEFCTPAESSPGSGLWVAPGGTADGIHWGYNVQLIVAQAVNAAALNVTTPAQAIAYYDTFGRGVKNTQAALDYTLNPANLGKEVKLGSAVINFNSTADQAIILTGPANFVVSRIVVRDPSINGLSTAQGGFYAGASKSTALLGTATTTPFADVNEVGGAHIFAGGTTVKNPSEIYASFTTPQGAAATATVDVYGINLAA